MSKAPLFESRNPATGALLESYVGHTPAEVGRRLEAAGRAAHTWRGTDIALRAGLLRSAAELLRQRADGLAELMAREMGKPVGQGRGEAEKCAWVCEYYAEQGEQFLQGRNIDTDKGDSFVHYAPLGVVLAIMPWNFPLWQVFRFAAPNLLAGNVGLLKHASNVSGCALAIESLLTEAGFAPGCFQTLLVEGETAGKLIGDDTIAAVTLTGSTAAGRKVAEQAGRALKPCVLELGGSDPYVILEDADLDLAVETCVASRLQNTGQSCIAAKRFIVSRALRERFEDALVEAMRNKAHGDPLDDPDLGPMARPDLRDELHRQVEDSVEAGARCLLGCQMGEGDGHYYPASVLTDVAPGMPAYGEELFGPVAAIIPADDEAHAIQIANDTSFGLGAAVFTQDLERGRRIAAQELRAGNCVVNTMVQSDPRLPFGGIKDSGMGRELSIEGIRAFCNVKTVLVGKS